MPKNIFVILVGLCVFVCLAGCGGATKGCTDPNSSSYDPNAEEDDGSCVYPENARRTLFVFFSNTSNSTAGSFALPLYNQALSANGTKVVPLVVFTNPTDTFFSGAAVDLAGAYAISGIPDIAAGSQASLLTQNQIQAAIDQNYATTPEATASLTRQIISDTMFVDVFGKFYTTATAQYFVAVYVTESLLYYPQAGVSDPNYRHNYVLRSAGPQGGIGQEIINGAVTPETSFRKRFAIPLKASWNKSELRVCYAIWKVDGGITQFVNAGVS